MIKVLLVDDEPRAIKTMTYIIDWESEGFVLAGHASNGKLALEMLAMHKDISIIITDLRMPEMDGIDLIKEIRQFSDIPIIVMSGYNDFQYAQQCIRYSVKDYLLKPVSENELISVLHSVKLEIDHRNELNRQLRMGLPALQDKLLKRWTHGYLLDEEKQQLLELNGSSVMDQETAVLLFEMDFMAEDNSELTQSEIDLKRFAVRNVLEEALESRGYVYEETDEQYGGVIFSLGSADFDVNLYQLAQELRTKIVQYTKVQVTVGIGISVSSVELVPVSYQTACHSLDQKYFSGLHNVIRPASRVSSISDQDLLILKDIEAIANKMRMGNRDEICELLRKQCEQMTSKQIPKAFVQSLVTSLCVHCYELLLEYTGVAVEYSPKQLDYEEIMNARTIAELFEYAKRKCLETIDTLKESNHSQSVLTISKVKKWVQDQYASNISLKIIAESLYINATYLGQQFKAAEGISFNDFLLKVRIEKAKELLQHTNLRVYEVAAQVGYQELDWFYKRFKEYTGMSTTKYRMQSRNKMDMLEV